MANPMAKEATYSSLYLQHQAMIYLVFPFLSQPFYPEPEATVFHLGRVLWMSDSRG